MLPEPGRRSRKPMYTSAISGSTRNMTRPSSGNGTMHIQITGARPEDARLDTSEDGKWRPVPGQPADGRDGRLPSLDHPLDLFLLYLVCFVPVAGDLLHHAAYRVFPLSGLLRCPLDIPVILAHSCSVTVLQGRFHGRIW